MAESTVVSSLQWIGSLLINETITLWEVEDKVRKLQQKLQVLQEYLQDADANPGGEVRTLTARVRQLAYDAEDLIDTYILKVTPKSPLSDSNWVVKSVRFLYKAPRAYKLGNRIQALQNDVSEVTKKLEKEEVQRTYSHFRETTTRRQGAPRTSYPYDEGEYVVGWVKDIQKLVQILMGQGTDQDIHMVAIMGMGGSGKTTIARKLYNHPYVKECFDCWAWVFISQQWSTQHILSEILRQVAGPGGQQEIKSNTNNYSITKEELIDKLRNILEKKSYLVVLDDVWSRRALQDILPALPCSKGSKIIITTRNKQIVQFQMPQSSYVYEPCPLDEDQGWQLLSKFSLSHRLCSTDHNQPDIASFERLGKEMLQKCDGLPLGIMALAGILSTKTTIGEWQQVSNAVRTRVMEGMGTRLYDRVEDLLALSYDDLPYYLKPCFLYLGLFPDDCLIPTGMLTRMWVAEGLVTPLENISLEEVAMLRLEELSNRFMIQVVRTNFKGDIKAIRLHDLLLDICVKKAKEQGFLKIYTCVEGVTTTDALTLATQPRRAGLHSSMAFPAQASQLRSLVWLTRSSVSHSAYQHKDTLELGVVHQSFKLLRLLNLWGIKTASGTLPNQIGNLIHLRYLGIRATNITELPGSIGSLRHLLTLDYRNVDSNKKPIKIPKELGKLQRLTHLFLPIDLPWIVDDQLKLHKMSKLQTLWGVKEDGKGYWLSREVPMLSTTLTKLRLIVSTQEDLEAIFSCPSLVSEGDGKLHTFHCELRDHVAFSQQLVKPLSSNQDLHKLILIGSIQLELSTLLPVNLIRLELKDSLLSMDPMPALGALAHLKLLKLSNFYTGSSFACRLGSFPQLEELYVDSLQHLFTWRIQQGAMRCLKKLEITLCKKLLFPIGLEFVTTLQQCEFFGVSKEFRQKASKCGWSHSPQKLRLPHNCEAIIEQCDSPIDISSIRKLYEQLTAGVFLNNKRKRFWVVMQDDCYYNCFMVYATGLFLAKSVDIDGLPEIDIDYWKWDQHDESVGATIEVLKLKLQNQFGPHVSGRLSIEDLSPDITYRITCVIKFSEVGKKTVPEMTLQSVLILPDGKLQKHEENLKDKPRDEWLHVAIGEFQTSPNYSQGGGFSLRCNWPSDLAALALNFKGLLFEPKL